MGDMVKGNVAMAEAALRGGMQIFCGYPLTPSTEILETLSSRAAEEGRVFIQAESEVSAITMIYGAASTGAKALTATSGLGMSLKQEGIAYLSQFEFPAVLINVVRYGDGLGYLLSGQTDYLRETRGGANGDYRNIVLSPSSVQEACDLVYESFDLAQKYRSLVVILTEGSLGQMMEDCDYPPYKEVKFAQWGMDGTNAPENENPDHFNNDAHARTKRMNAKRAMMREELQRWESAYVEDADYVFVAYGLPGRVVKGLVRQLRSQGEKVGFIRPISLWPFPEKAFAEVNPNVKGYITVENNDEGQMNEDIAIYGRKHNSGHENVPVYTIATGVGVPTRKEVNEKFDAIKSGEMKEVF